MTLFQILLLALTGLLFVATLIATIKGGVAHREGLIWCMVWLVAGFAVAVPGMTVVVARFLGIGRGADLILYCSVIVMLAGFLMVYTRLRALRRDLTRVVRELAILDADRRHDESTVGAVGHPGDKSQGDA